MHVVDVSGSSSLELSGGEGGGSSLSSPPSAPLITADYLEQVSRFDLIYARALKEMTTTLSTQHQKNQSPKDIDVRALLEKHGWPAKSQLNNLERAVEHNLLEVWVANQLENLSGVHDMKSGANDMDLGQDEMFVEDPRGFNSIFNILVADLSSSERVSIMLGKQVKTIYYEPANVKVVTTPVHSLEDRTKCTNEEIYDGDIVVSTVSLGVLQSGAIAFVPPLPDWKVKALNQVGMFTFAKVYARFRKRLWPDDKDYILFVSNGEEMRGYYPLWMEYKNTNEDMHLLMCYLGGSQAERVESLNEEQLKGEIEELFSKAFPLESNADCRPTSVAVTNWSRNPLFCGSYSYFPVGAFEDVPESDYRCGLTGIEKTDRKGSSVRGSPKSTQSDDESHGSKCNTLYFAGEAFDDKFNGWVQGGYLSGERVARSILDAIFGGRNAGY